MNPWKQRYRGAVAAAAIVFAIGCGSDGANGLGGATGADGSGGISALVKATAIANGDVNCPTGGLLVTTGLDNGDGGGTAGDGILQDGEVDDTRRFCDTANAQRVADFNPPAGAAGTNFINTSGGSATAAAASGGGGGYVYFEHNYGTNGGHIKVFKTGQVDASFTPPGVPATSYFGATPLVVASGTTHVKRVTAVTDSTTVDAVALVAGDIVALNTCTATNAIYKWNSVSSADLITGIHVQAGATLTFDDVTAAGCPTVHWGRVTGAIRNGGTITAARDAVTGTSDSVRLTAGAYIGGIGSSVTLTGATGGATGGNGGLFEVLVNQLPGSAGGVWNFGTIDTSGGSGDSGGTAGQINIRAAQTFINTGAVSAKGGDATTAAGTAGGGNTVRLYSGFGAFANSAAVDVSGGGGGTTAGGAGSIYLYNNSFGDFRNTGPLRANGGAPTAGCATSCQGGGGGSIYLYASGDLRNSANLVATGGAGLTGSGGGGGYIDIETSDDDSHLTDYYNSRGNIWVSGNLDTRGGDGANGGGGGGDVYVYTDLDYQPFGQEIVFFGYGGGITANGGNGPAGGGSANYVGFYNDDYGETYENDYTPAGAVINYADISLKGGTATTGTGGSGGYVDIYTMYQKLQGGDFERVVNYGNIDTSGGNGGSGGGWANYVYMKGLDGVDNHGNITARAGTASAASGTGGSCYTYEYSSEGAHGVSFVSDRGPVVNVGNVDNHAGDASGVTSTGGDSGGILVFGYDTTNSGSLNADGGDTPVADGTGGDGGMITIRSYSGAVTNTPSAMTAAGGTGVTGSVGANGTISINGQAL